MLVVKWYDVTTTCPTVRFTALDLKSHAESCHLATKSEVHISIFAIVVVATDLLKHTSVGFEKCPRSVYRRSFWDAICT
jgi:hypothetical protein